MADETKPSPKKPKREVQLDGPEGPVVYANNLQVILSQWDVRLRFGQLQVTEPDRLVVREVVQVYLSPAHAKAALRVLSKMVRKYEESVGALPEVGSFIEEDIEAADAANPANEHDSKGPS